MPYTPRDSNRARSLHYPGPIYSAVFFSVIHYLVLLATLTLGVLLATGYSSVEPMQLLKGVVLGLLVSGVTWVVAFLKRRSARCPLCKGTPLLNSAAAVHGKAYRLRPFNHGTTATLSVVFTQRFRCMYCGSTYDLLKKPGVVGRQSEDAG